jgi:hypothetical protein
MIVRLLMKRHRVIRQTFYRWRKNVGGLTEDEAQRLKRLERENARLKTLRAQRDLEVEVLREIHAKKIVAPAGPGGPRCASAGRRPSPHRSPAGAT